MTITITVRGNIRDRIFNKLIDTINDTTLRYVTEATDVTSDNDDYTFIGLSAVEGTRYRDVLPVISKILYLMSVGADSSNENKLWFCDKQRRLNLLEDTPVSLICCSKHGVDLSVVTHTIEGGGQVP